MDGRKQRQAVTAAEQAIRAVADGEVDKAAAAAVRATELDQIGAYDGLTAAIAAAGVELEAVGHIGEEAWDAVAAAVGPGPLGEEVATLRAG